jgi:hypothetical protein
VKFKNLGEVEAYLRTIPADAADNVKWRAVTTATRAVMRGAGMPNVGQWKVTALPPQAHQRHGDCAHWSRTIRYRKQFVHEWWITDLTYLIIHESAHAITSWEMSRQGKYGSGGHGPMWRGVMATLSYADGRAKNLPATRGMDDNDAPEEEERRAAGGKA